MRRWGMRTRLTVAVTAIFATASIVAGAVALRITEDRLLADTRANAEQMLRDYVGRLYGGTAAAPTVDAAESTSFFFLDAAGAELSERQYVTTLLSDALVESRIGAAGSVTLPPPAVPLAGGVGVDAAGQFVANNGEVLRFALAPTPAGAPGAVDRGAGVVAVAQTFAMPNGDRLQVGVSSPLGLVTDSIGAMRWLLWIGIPLVTAMVAAITWLTATRALRPVHAITVRAREITASNLAEPVPVPAVGTRSTSWQRRSTRCSPGSTPTIGSSASSSLTRRTNCAVPSLPARCSSRSPSPGPRRSTGPRRRARCSPSSSSWGG